MKPATPRLAFDRYHRPVLEGPPHPEPPKHVYSVRLSRVEVAALNEHVRRTGQRASDVFRDALAEYLERYA